MTNIRLDFRIGKYGRKISEQTVTIRLTANKADKLVRKGGEAGYFAAVAIASRTQGLEQRFLNL